MPQLFAFEYGPKKAETVFGNLVT